MAKQVEYVDWPDALDVWTPYTPAVAVRGGRTVYFAGVTAAAVYHHHPHRPEEFDDLPEDMESQKRAALENLRKSLESVGATFRDVVSVGVFLTDASVSASGRVRREFFGDHRPASTTVEVVRLATDPRCKIEINAVAVID